MLTSYRINLIGNNIYGTKNMKTIFCGVTPCSLVEVCGPVNIYQTTRCHVTKDNTFYNHTHQNIRYHKFVNKKIRMGFQFLVVTTFGM
jgi:hypothetical protein